MPIATAAAICAIIFTAPNACAADVGLADLQATARSLGFLDSLQNRAAISIGVVYGTNGHDDRDQAVHVAGLFAGMPGPGSSTIQASIVTADDLAKNGRRFDALYLMPDAGASGSLIADFIKRQHLVSVSSDPACLDAKYCVLMVQGGSGVNIVLNTALASAVDAHFSSVFTMMVKRR
ncbi:MAG: hypothetical protein KGJ79_03395 [Alphaproteobacteria bacterium]|nr:hypothetical protein [Alphaproteobacteria bacterium]MDE2110163.1 hypothetical protein [Alphaproteobacteria bacterium]MDE2492497.1 hypothetical protein [Alphaproteobacteria bacterium]